ncbi:ESPR-type extended signal peptide-containing protein, partial [Acinetobacter higginsii]
MNHIFKKIWNKSLGSMVVVSENARSAGKTDNTIGAVSISDTVTTDTMIYRGFGLQTLVLSIAMVTGSNVWAEVCDVNGSGATGGSTATGSGAFACGINNTISSSSVASNAIGLENFVSGAGYNSALGSNNTVSSSEGAVSVGFLNSSVGPGSTAMGTATNGLNPQHFRSLVDNIQNGVLVSVNDIAVTATGASRSTITHINGQAVSAAERDRFFINLEIGGNIAAGRFSSAVGVKNFTLGESSAAVGFNNNATKLNSSVFGTNSQAIADGATAIGNNSLANEANTVSVGRSGAEKRITNVAAASKGTDAVNLGQVQSLFSAIGVSDNYAHNSSDTALGSTSGITHATENNGTTLTKVAGISVTSTSTNLDDIDSFTINGITTTKAAAPDKVAAFIQAAKNGGNIAVGTNSSAVGISNIATGLNSNAVGFHNTSIGQSSTAIGSATSPAGRTPPGVVVTAGTVDAIDGITVVSTATSWADLRDNPTKLTSVNGMVLSEEQKSAYVNALRYGSNAAIGTASNAIGNENITLDVNSNAIGSNNKAIGSTSNALGRTNIASGGYSSAVGHANTSSGVDSNAFGSYNVASASSSNALGRQNTATGFGSNALGYQNTANGVRSVAVGSNNLSQQTGSTAIGAATGFTYAFYSNDGTKLTAINGIPVTASDFSTASITHINGLAVSQQEVQNFLNSIDQGGSIAFGTNSTAVGNQNIAAGTHSTAVGVRNIAGDIATAVGHNNTATGIASTAIGQANKASGVNSTSIGYDNESTGIFSNALGFDNQAAHQNSTAVGTSNKALGINSNAVGYFNIAQGVDSSAIGLQNSTMGGRSSALGYKNEASGLDSSALGHENKAQAMESAALGTDNLASGIGSNAVGNTNQALGFKSSALGSNNLVKGQSSSAVGSYNSVTGKSSSAAGVGGAALGNGSSVMGGALEDQSSFDPTQALTVLSGRVIEMDSSTMTGKIDGLDFALDSSNPTHPVTLGGRAFTIEEMNALMQAVEKGGAIAVGEQALAAGSRSTAFGDKAAAIGAESKAYADNSVALGAGSIADEANTISVGKAGAEKRITNVADAQNDYDAVNKKLLTATVADAVFYDAGSNKEKITLAGATGTQITNLKDATLDSNS